MDSSYTAGNWEIQLKQGQMQRREELESLSQQIYNIKLPDMIFSSFLMLTNKQTNLIYKVDYLDALKLIHIPTRESRFGQEEYSINSINVIPSQIKVADSQYWETRQLPADSNFTATGTQQVPAVTKILETDAEWTFTSPYKGHLEGNTENVQVLVTEDSIPINRLGRDNPIQWGGEVILYEDELDDNGQVKFNVRIRAMRDCFYALVRCYLRVDHVIARIYDTRIFHDYSTNEILREFQAKESTYEEIAQTGFNVNSQWTTQPE